MGGAAAYGSQPATPPPNLDKCASSATLRAVPGNLMDGALMHPTCRTV